MCIWEYINPKFKSFKGIKLAGPFDRILRNLIRNANSTHILESIQIDNDPEISWWDGEDRSHWKSSKVAVYKNNETS